MKLILYIATAVLSFLIFLIIFAPASPAWSLIDKDVQDRIPDLNVSRVGGTIWNGQAEIQFRQFPPSTLNWQLSPGKLIQGTAKFHLLVDGQGHSIQSEATLGSTSGSLQSAKGVISSDYINKVSEQYGLIFSGDLEFQELNVVANNDWITGATGSARWTGGQILLNQNQTILLPPLDGELYFQNQQLILDITEQNSQLIQIILKQSGWAEIAIKSRMLEIANLPLPTGSHPEETILLLEEKIPYGEPISSSQRRNISWTFFSNYFNNIAESWQPWSTFFWWFC
jgi:hypothetical protein